MTLLVTGGAGFIGSHFIYDWMERHPCDRVVCLDKLTYAGNLHTLSQAMEQPNFRFVKGDICDRSVVSSLFQEEAPEIVVNFAAESHVDRSIHDPEIFLRTNIFGVSVLLDVCCTAGNTRFHQISTDEVYGDLPLNRADLLFTEDSPLRASSPYSASKASADMLVLAYYRTYGLPVTISRCSNNYGPYQYREKLIPLMIRNALSGKPLPVYGTGNNVRDWLHVSDHCRAIEKILQYGRIGEIYNIGGNTEKRNIDIVQMICDKLGVSRDRIAFVADRQGHDLRYAVDAGKIKRELGWQPQVSFQDGMEETIQWYVEHQMWLEGIGVDKANVG